MKTSINTLILGKFGPKSEIYSQCYEIWQLEQVKFVNHRYDTVKPRKQAHGLTHFKGHLG